MKFLCHYIFLLQLFVVVLLSLCLQFLIFSWNIVEIPVSCSKNRNCTICCNQSDV